MKAALRRRFFFGDITQSVVQARQFSTCCVLLYATREFRRCCAAFSYAMPECAPEPNELSTLYIHNRIVHARASPVVQEKSAERAFSIGAHGDFLKGVTMHALFAVALKPVRCDALRDRNSADCAPVESMRSSILDALLFLCSSVFSYRRTSSLFVTSPFGNRYQSTPNRET